MKRWASLVLAVVLLAVAAWFISQPGRHPGRHEIQFSKIQPGMTVDEVKEIMGNHDPDCFNGTTFEHPYLLIWWCKDGWNEIQIEITLDGDKRVKMTRISRRLRI
jgi:hypothetical protein